MKKMIIGGHESESDAQILIVNPSDLQPVDSVSYTNSTKEIKEAVDMASEAFTKYSIMPLASKAEMLKKAAELIQHDKEQLAVLLAKESGKPISDARTEISRAISVFTNSAEEVKTAIEGKTYRPDAYSYPTDNDKRIVLEIREPLGVIGAILPFNFPANSFAHKVAPNLALGNTVIVKPSSQTPLTAIELAKLMYRAGFPQGTISVVVGNAEKIGTAMATDKRISGITFTGSTKTGNAIAALAYNKKLMLELGGSDPFIVFEDADLERAARVGVRARFEYAGQNCNAAKRFIVHERVYDEFTRRFIGLAGSLRVGNALDESTEMGPLINNSAVQEAKSIVKDTVDKGGKLLLNRETVNAGQGYFMGPVVIGDADIKSRAMQEETFAPVAPIFKFKSKEEAVEAANSSQYGLQAAIFTNDISTALDAAKRIKVGAVLINDSTRLRWDTLPFGGLKDSSIGEREGIRSTAIAFSEAKLISLGAWSH